MKKKNTPYILLFSVWGLLAIIFAFTDMPILQKYANPQSGWAHFMEVYGQLPGMLAGFLGGNLLLRITKLERTIKSIGSAFGFLILTAVLAFGFWGDALGQQVDSEINYPLAITLGVITLVVVQVWLHRIPDEILQTFKPIGQIALLLFVISNLTVWGIKIPWGRWTYRDMLEIGDLSLFTPWYLPQGNNGHHSFISGHTAIAFCVLPVVLLFGKNKKRYTIVLILALTWGVIGALSRVVIGAHFPSDVLFAAGLTILWFLLLSRRYKIDFDKTLSFDKKSGG